MLQLINVLISKIELCADILSRIYALLKESVERQERFATTQPLTQKTKVLSLMDVGDDEELLTIDDACERLRIVRTTLMGHRQNGDIIDVKIGARGVRFRASDVEKLRKWYSVPKGKV